MTAGFFGFDAVSFGAGSRNPLALPFLFFLGGASHVYVVDPELGNTRLHWLTTGPTRPSPVAVKAELAKYAFLRGLDAHELDLSTLPTERRPASCVEARTAPGRMRT